MNGPQHYREGEQHMSAAERLDRSGGRPVDPTVSMFHLMAAQAHFAAAEAAAAADQLADRYVGDGPHINEWRDAVGRLAPAEVTDDDPWAAKPDISVDIPAPVRRIIARHLAEALVDSRDNEVQKWARGIAYELKHAGADLTGDIEKRITELTLGPDPSDPPF